MKGTVFMLYSFMSMSDSYFHGLYNKWGFARLLEVSFYRRNFSFCSCITSSDVFCLIATSRLVLSHTAYDPKLCGKLTSLLRSFIVYVEPEDFGGFENVHYCGGHHVSYVS